MSFGSVRTVILTKFGTWGMGLHPARRSCLQRPSEQQPHRSPSSEANHFPRNGFGWPSQLLHSKGIGLPGKVATEDGWSSLPTPFQSHSLHGPASRFGLLVCWFTQLVCKFWWLPPKAQLSRHHLLSRLRLGEKSLQRSQNLAKRADEISDLNTAGIVDGFTGEYLASKKTFCLRWF